jgi:uncharacterized membrane protein YphA (DoxX/SURF4 family)
MKNILKYITYTGTLICAVVLFFGGYVQTTSAHVAYVVPEEKMSEVMGEDWAMLTHAVSNPINSLLTILTIILILFLAGTLPRIPLFKKISRYVVKRLETYHEFIPWIIRIGVGIALLGAGTTGVLISPSLPHMDQFAVMQIALGFLFLLGFLLVPITIAAIILYVIALSTDIYLIGNIEVLALLIGFLVFHSYRPGLDDIFNFQLFKHVHFSRQWLAPILRLGIGIAMIFLALYEKILNPHMSEEVVSMYNLTSVVPVDVSMWVLGAGIIELAVGLFLLIGFYTRTTALIAFMVLSTTFFLFKESVTAHITLFALLSILLIEGGGRWSVDKLLYKTEKVVFVIVRNPKGKFLLIKRDKEPHKGAWAFIAGKGGLREQKNKDNILLAADSELFWDIGQNIAGITCIYSDAQRHICELVTNKKVAANGHALDIQWCDPKKYAPNSMHFQRI